MKLKKLTLENVNQINHNGIYRIFLCNKNGNQVKVKRFCGIDNEGLIYIGAAQETTISNRLTNFIHSMNKTRKQNNHSAGKKICDNNQLSNYISKNTLYFDCIKVSNAKNREKTLLKLYKETYGEVPPLNG